ncbi:PrsW family glutamic-type intramembrane protease [Leptospira ellisii]|uniref:PrsW family glutamic-type intramembrane protease n=1 Tax=Leptospira ellisii TaxID=2023197 RepID=A0A2N0BKI4_9LEPT|nr:PrsW family glutamic-type intramembrane protease [Leptospira ellisii]MDV6236815.1 PrsW family glutamic-type intramembrane protease [Leptospira ellisii]PJZ93900.1 PrsW family intramembrane metalloprotease [Leptospira ellisii]PKA04523.1 PrsW family intramembrane metalloprotease [Leptospira ellisii]
MNVEVASLGFLSVLPWGAFLILLFPGKNTVQRIFLVLLALFLGYLSTEIVLKLHPIFWPDVKMAAPKRSGHILTQTAHIAFIQAGMMEEFCKGSLIFFAGLLFAFDWKRYTFKKEIVLIGGFVALGFAGVENANYIFNAKEEDRIAMFVGRTIRSSNAHFLINLCFSLAFLKSNFKESKERPVYLFLAFLLAVSQHGLFNFFVLPQSRFGGWLSTALFVGIWVWIARDFRAFVREREILDDTPVEAEILENADVRETT